MRRTQLLLLPLVVAATAAPGLSLADPPSPLAFEAIVNDKSGKCLAPAVPTVGSTPPPAGTPLALYECNGTPDQRWAFRLVRRDGDLFEIVHESSKLCLDLAGTDGNEDSLAVLTACADKPDQLWAKVDAGGGAIQIRNGSGIKIPDYSKPFQQFFMCLDVKGTTGAVGSLAKAYRCPTTAVNKWRTPATGAAPTLTPAANGTKSLCASPSGPCIDGNWTGTAPNYTATGNLVLAKVPTAGATLSLSGNVGARLAGDFAVQGNAAMSAKLPLGSDVVTANLPSGAVEVGYGSGIQSLLGNKSLSIGGRPYKLQPSGFYAHAKVNAAFSLDIAGITAQVPGGGSAEVFLGFESKGPSAYLSGDCNIAIVGPPKVKDGPPTSLANISSCTLGWFGSQPLPHTLSVPILDPSKGLPAVGSQLSTVQPTIAAAILVGGAITFAALPAVTFNGMMAIDPDQTAASSASFRNLSKAKAGLEGDATVSVSQFSMTLARASMVYDVPSARIDLAATVPVTAPFTAIGATFGRSFSGNAYAAGRFGVGSNQLVFDFSKAKLFDFDLDDFQGQLDFNKKSLAVSGKLEFGKEWVSLTGSFAAPSHLSLTGGAGLKLDGTSIAGASLTVGTSGVRFKGSVSLSGKNWTFDDTLDAPRTVKSNILNNVGVTIPGVVGVTADVWAQYTMGGNLSVKAKLSKDVLGWKTSDTFTVDTDGKIDLKVFKVKVL
jgi:hypothetical protein